MQTLRVGIEGVAHPRPEEIREELQRILASSEFHAPDRGRRFLEFVVEETLAGRSDCLKAYTIAQEVFAREASFDAQNDPVVRIEAGRIRRALERYYLVAGRADAVVLTIPKGGYVPFFSYATDPAPQVEPSHDETNRPDPVDEQPVEPASNVSRFRHWPAVAALSALLATAALLHGPLASFFTAPAPSAASSTASDQPRILVGPFTDISENNASSDIAQGLTDEVISQLARFKEVVVLAKPGATAAEDGSKTRLFALQGSVRVEGEKLRMIVRLVRSDDGAVIWANNYDADLHSQGPLDVQADVAQRIATAIAQPYGSIFQTDAADVASLAGGDWNAYACMRSYYSYRTDLNPQNHGAVRDCLKQATERLPTNSTFWALLSQTYLDEIRFQYQLGAPSSPNILALADDAAERAADLDPQNARALQAVMLVSFFKGDIDTALKAGASAYAINPNDTEVAGEYGFRLAMSGRWDSGCELMSGAIARNPGPKGYFEVGLALCAYIRNDIQAAELWARMANLKYNPMHHLVLLTILGSAGKLDEAAKEKAWLDANAPVLVRNIQREIAMRLHRPEDQERFFAGLRAAGMNIPPAAGAVAKQ